MLRQPSTILLVAMFVVLNATLSRGEGVDFAKEIFPIFEKSCLGCHGPKKQKGKLRLDRKSAVFTENRDKWVVQPGNAKESKLFQLISLPADDLDIMPADGDPLSAEAIARIGRWIDEGAVWTESATPAPPEKPLYEPIVIRPLSPDEKAAEDQAVATVRELGALTLQVASDTIARDANFSLLGKKITDAELQRLKGLERTLVWLNLSKTAITDAGLAQLVGFSELRRIHLAGTNVSDAGLAHFSKLSQLEFLNLYGTQITDAGLKHLQGLPKLRKLFVWKTGVTEGGIAALEKKLPELQIIRGVRQLVAVKPKEDTLELPECCAAASAKGEKCKHPCCIEAAAQAKICEKCAKK